MGPTLTIWAPVIPTVLHVLYPSVSKLSDQFFFSSGAHLVPDILFAGLAATHRQPVSFRDFPQAALSYFSNHDRVFTRTDVKSDVKKNVIFVVVKHPSHFIMW